MTSRWKGKGRSSNLLLQQQQHKIQQLELLVDEKDEAIADLQRKLTEQLQTVKKLRRDRQELRDKNASIVGKLAEVSRKNSCANIFSTTPPTNPRVPYHRTSTTRLPNLPTTPESPSLHHNSTPSSSEGTPDTPSKNRLLPPHPPKKSSTTEDSDTDFEEIEEKGDKKKELKSSLTGKMDPGGSTQAEIDNELAAVLNTARNSELSKKPVPAAAASNLRQSSSPPHHHTRKRQDSSTSSTSSSASFGSAESREGNYKVRALSDVSSNPPKMKKIQSSEQLASALRQMMPKRISQHSLDGNDTKGPPQKYPQENGGVASATSGESYSSSFVVVKKRDTSPGLQSNGASVPRNKDSSPGLQSNGPSSCKSVDSKEERATQSGRDGGVKAKKKTTFSASSDIIPVSSERSWTKSNTTDSTSSDYPSSETFPTDMESSMEVFSPTMSPPETKSSSSGVFIRTVHKSLPELDLGSGGVGVGGVQRPATSTARMMPVFENRRSAALDDSNLEENDTLDELSSFSSKVRARTQTLSSLTGGKRRVELGRMKAKDLKRFSSVSNTNRILQEPAPSPRERANTIHELELLSPIFQAKIRQMTLKKIYSSYGGKDVVTKAVDVIINAYQTYRLKQRFLERQKEKRENRTLQRKRAQTLKPQRRPSIMSKSRDRYKRGKDPMLRGEDPILKTAEVAERLAKERVPHAHSRARQQLIEKKRQSESSLKGEMLGETLGKTLGEEEEEREEGKEDEAEKDAAAEKAVVKRLIPTLSISQIKVDWGCEDEGSSQEIETQDIVFTLTTDQDEEKPRSSTMLDKPDGLVGSESAQSLSSEPRPLSIFSISSMESSVAEYSSSSLNASGHSLSASGHSRTLPPPSRMRKDRKDEKKEVDMKLMTGIYYFNKKPVKGIQYLIRNSLLEDDPKGVADFFIHQKGLSKEKIGEFLGVIGSEFNMAVLESIVERSNMGDKPIDEALREFQQLFRMPGEAQKIDKIMEVFALEYHKHNKSLGVFKSEDGAYILSFAIMMLHTALHNPSVKTRTSRKQWLSMNRGNNDGENFPHSFLMEIFDRIQATEFATGKDHTHRVAEIEKQITGLPIQKLSVPYRYLVLKMSTSEIQELGVRPGFRSKHRRVLFFFNDIAVICKRKNNNEYVFKETFSLLNILPVKFESQHYKYGVQLHAVDKDTPYQFNCDSSKDRDQLLHSLETITQHLKVLESERIAALGTTLTTNRLQDHAANTAGLVCDAGDLISSMSLAAPSPSSQTTKHMDDFVPGVGDLVTTSLPANFIQIHAENRISRDSGFSSQQLTPTPPHSPSIAELNPAFATPTISPTGSINTLVAPVHPIRTSKSSDFDELKQPTSSPNRSPSMDFLSRRRRSTPSAVMNNASPLLDGEGKAKKKDRGSSDKGHKKGIFSFGKTKVKDSSDGGKSRMKNLPGREDSASPQPHRKLVQNHNRSLDSSSLETSTPPPLTAALH